MKFKHAYYAGNWCIFDIHSYNWSAAICLLCSGRHISIQFVFGWLHIMCCIICVRRYVFVTCYLVLNYWLLMPSLNDWCKLGWNDKCCSDAKSAMSNPNDLLSQKLCDYLNQSCTLNVIHVNEGHTLSNLIWS